MSAAKRPASWGEIQGHQAAVARLRRMLRLGRLPHALLFAGPPGIGKRLVAEVFAADILQTEPALLGAHPDYSAVSPEGAQIRIGQIREIQRMAGLAPVRGKQRVCVLEPADSMEAPAANSLLKILEEPPEGFLFILITALPHHLLPTLRSRAALVRFFRPAGGALPWEDPASETVEREQAFALLRHTGQPDLEWLWPALSGMEDWDGVRILDVVRHWIRMLRDMGILLAGCGDVDLYNDEKREELRSLAGRWDVAGIAAAVGIAEETRRQLQRNANARLMLESMLIRSADICWGGKGHADYRGGPV